MRALALAKKAIFSPSKVPLAAKIEFLSLLSILRHGLPDVMLQFLGGVGDELLLTAVAHELKKRSQDIKIWQVSHPAELLRHNPDYSRVLDWNYWYLRYSHLLDTQRCHLSYSEQIVPGELEKPPEKHIIAELCRKAGIRGEVSIRPYMYLTDDEKKLARVADRQIALQCVGEKSYENVMRNKLYPVGSFQKVVNLIRKESMSRHLKIIQLGGSGDPALIGVIDLRGKTTLRQTAAIISQSDAFIGTQGFLAHLARAVDCRSVIIFGGREHSYQSGYSCNENIESYLDCAPCWRWNSCEYDRKCMTMIEPELVAERVKLILKDKGTPLSIDVVEV
jgi:hypothetical protein